MDDDTPKYESFPETEQDSGSTIRPNGDVMGGKRIPLAMGGNDNVPFDSVTSSSHKETINVYGRKLNDEGPKRGDLLANRYQVVDELGRGGMGVVFRCFDTIAGVEVALKALPQLLSSNMSEMEEVKDNFQLVSGLVHTNIAVLKTLERDPANGAYYLVMELVRGDELRHWLRERWRETGGTLPLDEALPILRQVAEALDYAHSRKIIHRDVKPANVMLCEDGLVKVMDFGLAAQIHTSLSRVSQEVVSTSGTQAYMAPEQWRGEPQGTAADQYALAAMTYEMLSGHLPFEAVDAGLMRLAVLNEEVRPINGVPETANGALKRALSKKATDRFPSCGDFVKALAGEKPLSVSPSMAEPRRPEMTGVDSGQLMQEVYLLQAEMEKKKKLVEEANYDRGQTFGEHLDEFSRNYTLAERVMADAANPERFRLAYDWYGKALAEVEWLARNEQLRDKVQELLPKVKNERDKVKNEDAEQLAEAEFNSANEQLVNAEKAFENGEIADALELLGKAKESFKRVFDTIIAKHLNAAETALAQGYWDEVLKEAAKVSVLERKKKNPSSSLITKANQLAFDADAGEKKEEVTALLAEAKSAYDANEWRKVQNLADEILVLGDEYVPVEYEAARKLKTDATIGEKKEKVAALLATAQSAYNAKDWKKALDTTDVILALGKEFVIADYEAARRLRAEVDANAQKEFIAKLFEDTKNAYNAKDWRNAQKIAHELLTFEAKLLPAERDAARNLAKNIEDEVKKEQVEKKKEVVVALLATAQKAYDAQLWGKAQNIADKILALGEEQLVEENEAARKLKEDAKEGEKKENVFALLVKAQSAYEAKDWKTAQKTADEILSMDTEHVSVEQEAAWTLKADAERRERIERLLDDAGKALRDSDWKRSRTLTEQALVLGANNAETKTLLAEADARHKKALLKRLSVIVVLLAGVVGCVLFYLLHLPLPMTLGEDNGTQNHQNNAIQVHDEKNKERVVPKGEYGSTSSTQKEAVKGSQSDVKEWIWDCNGLPLKLIKVKAGKFQMGSPDGELGRDSSEKQHWVTLTQDFWLGKTEVTQGQWKAVMGNNPSMFKKGDDYPVETVNWEDAMSFCDKLNDLYKGKLPSGYEFSLPTEAQWEYACRAGTTTSLNSGVDISSEFSCPNLDAVGWHGGNSESTTHPVGEKKPNAWGFYDMHGNVAEWCFDWFDSDWYGGGEMTDPKGPSSSSYRVRRGGGWDNYGARYYRSAYRNYSFPSYRYVGIGFRVVLAPVQKSENNGVQVHDEQNKEKVVSKEASGSTSSSEKEAVKGSQSDVKEWIWDCNGLPLKLIKVKAGKFLMGSPDGELGRESIENQHWVTLTQDYWLGETEVTQGQWKALMGDNPSSFKKGDDYPVESVNWEDAMKFCGELNDRYKGKLPPGYRFSLPTEAQWEYACRAGTTTALNSGLDLTSEFQCPHLDAVGWYYHNSSKSTHPVAQKQKNTWGFYDMHGNVGEWCYDWYDDDYLSFRNGITDPKGPATGRSHVIRGGDWNAPARFGRSANRNGRTPSYRYVGLGFRVVLAPVQNLENNGIQAHDEQNKGRVIPKEASDSTFSRKKEVAYVGQLNAREWIVDCNGLPLKLIKVKAGKFLMGSPEGELGRHSSEKQHWVTLTRDYWLGETEVTQGQWKAIMGDNPPCSWMGDDYPMEKVSWDDAMKFCGKLNDRYKGKLPSGYKFSLPTEAQWEYACRAGTSTSLNSGVDISSEFGSCTHLNAIGWYFKNGRAITHPVGKKKPNAWGFYDMHGNICEWCSDGYGDYSGDATDPEGTSNDSRRVSRGGSWNNDARRCRSAYRFNYSPSLRSDDLGFRLALVPVQQSDNNGIQAHVEQNIERGLPKDMLVHPGSEIEAVKGRQLDAKEWIMDCDGLPLKLIKVKAGRFQMGSPEGELGRESIENQHWVTLTQDYWLGETEVTQGQWKALMGDNPSSFKKGDDYPVENVSWDDAMKFCGKLNDRYRGKLPYGYKFALPTEAQWEYACRAGTKTSLNSGKNITSEEGSCSNLDEVGWYCENPGHSTHPVAQKQKNAWGFYDMHGNVYEWCSDWYGDYSGNATDPRGPANGSYRVNRGGSWNAFARYCRAAFRDGDFPSYRYCSLGFRLALVPVQ